MNPRAEFIVWFTLAMSIISVVAWFIVYSMSIQATFRDNQDVELISYLNSVHRFANDTQLSTTDRIDILKTTHLVSANELSRIQQINNEPFPLAWAPMSILALFPAIIFLAVAKACYDEIQEQRNKFPRDPL